MPRVNLVFVLNINTKQKVEKFLRNTYPVSIVSKRNLVSWDHKGSSYIKTSLTWKLSLEIIALCNSHFSLLISLSNDRTNTERQTNKLVIIIINKVCVFPLNISNCSLLDMCHRAYFIRRRKQFFFLVLVNSPF